MHSHALGINIGRYPTFPSRIFWGEMGMWADPRAWTGDFSIPGGVLGRGRGPLGAYYIIISGTWKQRKLN